MPIMSVAGAIRIRSKSSHRYSRSCENKVQVQSGVQSCEDKV